MTAGFGGFLVQGGVALDDIAVRSAGGSEREGRVRATLVASLEHGILAIPCSAAAIALLAAGAAKPPHDFTLPWAILPGVGFIVGLWAAERYRERLRDRGGWRGKLSVALDAAHLVGAMLRHLRRYWSGVGGMLIFWLADMFALWAAMAAFGFHMNAGAVVVAFGTAMVVTRRPGPLGGAGILGVALPPTLWYSGAPWVQAVLGTFSYRFFMLWLPLPFAFLALPRLRALLDNSRERPGVADEEPALQNCPSRFREASLAPRCDSCDSRTAARAALRDWRQAPVTRARRILLLGALYRRMRAAVSGAQPSLTSRSASSRSTFRSTASFSASLPGKPTSSSASSRHATRSARRSADGADASIVASGSDPRRVATAVRPVAVARSDGVALRATPR